jgi:hypothetical protein
MSASVLAAAPAGPAADADHAAPRALIHYDFESVPVAPPKKRLVCYG